MKAWFPLAVIVATIPLVATVRGCAGPTQRERIAEAVPGFTCPELYLTPGGGHYDWHFKQRLARSAMHMPAECRASLERLVAPLLFAQELCGPQSRCWSRNIGGDEYRFAFERGYVGFTYRYSGP